MAVKIRLARRGRRKQPYYHIIVADARSPRDGKFIEQIGSYNPMTKPATIDLDREKAYEWLLKGAQPTDTARSILRFKGVMYKKHLQRGVTKGAMTQEEADNLFQEYIAVKEAKVAARFEQTLKEKLEFHKKVSGSPKKVYVEEAPATEEQSAFHDSGADDKPEAEIATPEVAETAAPEAVETAKPEAEEAVEVVAEATVEEATPEAVETAKPEATEAEEVVAEPAVEEVKVEAKEVAEEVSKKVPPVASTEDS